MNGIHEKGCKFCTDGSCSWCSRNTTQNKPTCCENCYGRQGTRAGGGTYCMPRECWCHTTQTTPREELHDCTGCTKQAAEAITEAENHGYDKGVRDSLEALPSERDVVLTPKIQIMAQGWNNCLEQARTAISTLLT